MNSGVFEKINELDLNKNNYLETILTGEHAGEKGLFVEDQLCWTDNRTDFFEQRTSDKKRNIEKIRSIFVERAADIQGTSEL